MWNIRFWEPTISHRNCGKKIDQVKTEEFQLTYDDGQYLYLAKGYGTRESSGYNISVKDLYLTEHTIVFETRISGPTEGEDVSRRETTPYIVVKTGDLRRSGGLSIRGQSYL